MKIKEFSKASKIYRSLVEREGSAENFFNCGVCQFELGNLENACYYLKFSKEGNPNDDKTYWMLGVILARLFEQNHNQSLLNEALVNFTTAQEINDSQ